VLLDGLAAPTVRMRVWRGQTLPGVLDRTLEEHRLIADALDAHDADLAYAAEPSMSQAWRPGSAP
jgi:GntR family transcriptional repressor for pyruvate dehydrogenase complex